MMVLPAFWNSAHEPVVKSCSRVPTARMTSASSHSRFAAPVPVTPTAPMFRGSVKGSEDLPPCVSITGMPCFAAKAASVAEASENKTPPPAMMTGFFASRRMRTASASSLSSGRTRRCAHTRSSKKLSG